MVKTSPSYNRERDEISIQAFALLTYTLHVLKRLLIFMVHPTLNAAPVSRLPRPLETTAVITVARFSDDRTQEGITTEATANILMISAAFGLSIFVLV